MHPVRPISLLLFALALVLPALAAADVDETSLRSAVSRELPPRPITRTRSVGEPGSTRPSAIQPVQGLHAEAFPNRLLGLWAEGHGFALGRRAALYDLAGGASLRLDEGVHLTASYRMLGIDLGFDADVEGADGGSGIAAPFIGLAFDF